MSDVRLEGVRKSFGAVEVIKGVDLSIGSGEFAVFVGPSGCGKSTLLRMVCGLESVTAGSIGIESRNVTRLPPGEREVAMVFQSYALYPHMTVEENMSFGLRMTGTPADEIARRVAEAARILQIEPLLQRKPKQLSGGQRQRVAIGRAIVRKPKVFLFDEPLSNLDAALRVQMRVEIARLHSETRRHHDLRHPRPDRGDDAGRPHRRAQSRRRSSRWARRSSFTRRRATASLPAFSASRP